nr:3,4-dihydroxy-2-butanone-4-phosphate synthase [Pseudohoeflea sp. DP4N28-3]
MMGMEMPHPGNGLAPIETILDDARAGRMSILVDDEYEEDEGDLFVPAAFANAAAVNFMAAACSA